MSSDAIAQESAAIDGVVTACSTYRNEAVHSSGEAKKLDGTLKAAWGANDEDDVRRLYEDKMAQLERSDQRLWELLLDMSTAYGTLGMDVSETINVASRQVQEADGRGAADAAAAALENRRR